MKVVSKTTNDSETSVEVDLFEGRKLPTRIKKRIQDEVGNFLVEQTIILGTQSKSPVQGASNFKALTSKEYKLKKQKEVGNTKANLEFSGQMWDEFDYEPTDKGVAVGVYGERAPAADGHNNLSGKSSLPTRRSIPDVGQNYKKDIQKEVERIIADVIAEESTFKRKDFINITTKKALYDRLATIFGPMSRAELNLAVFRSEELTNLMKELDLVGLL